MNEKARVLHVKQRMGQVAGRYCEMAVYMSGVPGWYVFRPLQEVSPGTWCEGGLEFAYKGSDLVRGWKRKLH